MQKITNVTYDHETMIATATFEDHTTETFDFCTDMASEEEKLSSKYTRQREINLQLFNQIKAYEAANPPEEIIEDVEYEVIDDDYEGNPD